jgi:hypothetical protein
MLPYLRLSTHRACLAPHSAVADLHTLGASHKEMIEVIFAILLALSLNTALAGPKPPTGGSKVFNVTPTNLHDHPFGFRVTTGAIMLGFPKQDTVHFNIEVTERGQPFRRRSGATLWISDGHDFIASVEIAAVQNGKTLKFEFDLARKYLGGETEFLFHATRRAPTPKTPEYELGDFYRFALPAFAKNGA